VRSVFQFLNVDRPALSAKVGLRIARDQEATPKLDEYKSVIPIIRVIGFVTALLEPLVYIGFPMFVWHIPQ
jgi:hypothetical protein